MSIDFTNLRWSIQALARPAGEQVTLFPDFTCKADELALTFEEHAQPFLDPDCDALDAAQHGALLALDKCLDGGSGMGKNAANWTEEGLYADGFWPEMRRLAAIVLDSFGWDNVSPPQSDNVIYVGPPKA